MRAILIFILCTVAVFSVCSQNVKPERVVDSSAVWSRGNVVLSDTQHISGMVKYNKITGLLQVENDHESRSLTPSAVLRFNFYDSLLKKQRKFISYGFENLRLALDPVAPAKGLTSVKVRSKFFEVLMELDSFAILCMTGPLSITRSNGSIGNYNFVLGVWNVAKAKQPSTTYSYAEQLYIFDRAGKVMPLLLTFNREKDGMLFDMHHTMRFAKMTPWVVQQYTGTHFQQVDDYAYGHKLSYEKKEDILKMFEYYRTLISPSP